MAIIPTGNGWIDNGGFGGLVDGLLQGYGLSHQIKQQAMQQEAHQRNMAMQDREMQVQDIQQQMMMQQNGRPVNNGTVEDQVQGAPGMSEIPGNDRQIPILRPVDKSRLIKYKTRDGQELQSELYTPEEQTQRAALRQASANNTLEDAKTTADINRGQTTRNLMLKAQGGGTPASGMSAIGIQDGTPLTRQEFADATEKVAKVRKEGMFTLKPGEKLTDVSGVPTGGSPKTVATGGDPLPTDDFGKYFLPAYTAKALKKPLAEVTQDDIKKLTPEQTRDAFTQFGSAKETPDTKAMRGLAQQTAQMHQAMLQMQMGQMPTRDDAKTAAGLIINHQMSPSQATTMFGGFGAQGQAFKRMMVSEATKMEPGFNFEEAESTYALVKSPAFQNTVRYMDSVQESIPLLIDRANKLGNGNIRGLNAMLNSGKNQVNSVDLKKFNTDRLMVNDEVAKILQGGGTGSATSDAKLKQAGEVAQGSDSPRAIAAAYGEIQTLIGYRRKATTRGTYMEGTQAGGGTPEKPAATSGGQFQVTDPRGVAHTFSDQASADAFKKAAGIQ